MKKLRVLFILGWVIMTISIFIPYKTSEHGKVSAFDEVQILFRENPGDAFIVVVISAISIVYFLLTVRNPKRWVFLSGAIIAAFFLLLDLNTPAAEGEKLFLIPRIVDYIAYIFVLTGFFIKPETK